MMLPWPAALLTPLLLGGALLSVVVLGERQELWTEDLAAVGEGPRRHRSGAGGRQRGKAARKTVILDHPKATGKHIQMAPPKAKPAKHKATKQLKEPPHSTKAPAAAAAAGTGATATAKVAAAAAKPAEAKPAEAEPCLCSFGIDRALAGMPGNLRDCPQNLQMKGVPDTSRPGGDLTFSEAGHNLGKTFCKRCYLAVVSTGAASGKGSKKRAEIVKQLKASGAKLVSEAFSGPSAEADDPQNCGEPKDPTYTSTLVLGCNDGTKHEALKKILALLKTKHQVDIKPSNVYHFDDRDVDIGAFEGSGFNAVQVSCRYRDSDGDGEIGRCGAWLKEVQELPGINKCAPPAACDPGGLTWTAAAGGATCGELIESLKQSKLDEAGARKKVATEHAKECGRCHPESSQEMDREAINVDHDEVEALDGGLPELDVVGTKYKSEAAEEADLAKTFKVHYNVNARQSFGAINLRLDGLEEVSPAACKIWCLQNEDCDCATYDEKGHTCWLRKRCDPPKFATAMDYNVFVKERKAPAKGVEGECKTATISNGMEQCYRAAMWAKNNGIKKRPKHFKSLTDVSPFEDFQNHLYRQPKQQGCTVMACEAPPGPNYGTAVLVTKGLGARDYGKVRVSLLRYTGDEREDSGDVQWTYKAQFKNAWQHCHIKTGLVDVVPGEPKTFNLDGNLVSIRIPKRDEGSVGLVMADPCIRSCEYAGVFAVKDTIQTILHSLRVRNSLDYWVTVGDNFYDMKGHNHKDLFGGLSFNASSVLFGATLGNHDFWSSGSPFQPSPLDTRGHGHVQWYAQDAMSAKEDASSPFKLSSSPKESVDVSNTFWYNSIGNVVLIGFSNHYEYDQQDHYFREACEYAGKVKPALVLLLGHWNKPGMGCAKESDTPAVWRRVQNHPGCAGRLVKYVTGHTHRNMVLPDKNFMVGSWGYGHDAEGGQFGLPFFDTRGGRARLHYFELAEKGSRLETWDHTMNCLTTKGIDGCAHLPSHKLWMDEPISTP